jgi:cell division protein FtsZ
VCARVPVSVAGAGTFIDFVAINTDIQALAASQADVRVQVGDDGARGLGAGGIPAVGRAAAVAAEDDLYPIVAGVDMVRARAHLRRMSSR